MRIAVLLIVLIGLLSTAWAKECVAEPGTLAWKHASGLFLRQHSTSREWKEYDATMRDVASFVEVRNDGREVILRDANRGLQVLLRDQMAALKHDGEESYRQLCTGVFLRVADCA